MPQSEVTITPAKGTPTNGQVVPQIINQVGVTGMAKAAKCLARRVGLSSLLLLLLTAFSLTVVAAAPTLVATIPVGNNPLAVGANPATNRIYVANVGNTVSVIDSSTNSVVATIPVGNNPFGVGVNPTTNRIYVAIYGTNNLSVIDGSNNMVTANIPVGSNPFGVGVNPTTNRIYVVNYNSNTLSVIDGSTNNVFATIPVGNNPYGVSVNSTTNRIYVVNYEGNTVSVIDGSTNNVVATIPVGTNPAGVGVNPTTNRIYVANYNSNNLSVIDGSTNNVFATIPVGTNPFGVGVNSTTNRIYVANYNSNTLSLINGNTNTVSSTTDVGNNPTSIAINPNISRIYVTNFSSNTVSVIEDIITARFTDVSLTSTPNPAEVGQSITFTATLTPITATGTLTFTFGTGVGSASVTSPLVNGIATYITSTLAPGSTPVQASYGGNANLDTSTSPVYIQTVNKIATSVEVSNSPNPTPFGQTATFTATVTPVQATGQVTFTIGTVSVSAALNNGVATYVTNTLATGSYAVSAQYSGSSVYSASTSTGQYTHVVIPLVPGTIKWQSSSYSVSEGVGTAVFTVTRTGGSDGVVSTTITILDNTATGSDYTAPAKLTIRWADGESGGKPVSFGIVDDSQGEDTENFFLKLTSPQGGATLGNPFQTTITIQDNDKFETSVSLMGSPNPSTYGQAVTFEAYVGSSAPDGVAPNSGVVTFTFDSGTTATVDITGGGFATYVTNTLAVGTHSVTTTYGGNAQHNPSPPSSPHTQVVSKLESSLNLTSSANPVAAGTNLTITVTVSPLNASGLVTFSFNGTAVASSSQPVPVVGGVATYVTSTLAVGTYSVTASYSGDSTYLSSTSQPYSQMIIAACNPQLVTSPSDDGQATTCGTFSYALATTASASGATISFALAGTGNTIIFTGSLTPTLKPSVAIDGGSGIVLEGNRVAGDGLRLGGGNTLTNLTIRNFGGRELLATVSSNATNQLFRVKVQS